MERTKIDDSPAIYWTTAEPRRWDIISSDKRGSIFLPAASLQLSPSTIRANCPASTLGQEPVSPSRQFLLPVPFPDAAEDLSLSLLSSLSPLLLLEQVSADFPSMYTFNIYPQTVFPPRRRRL